MARQLTRCAAAVSLARVRAFIAGFLLSLSLCVDLGMVNVALMRTAVLHGVRAALAFGAGSTLGDLVYAALSAMGAAAVMSNPLARRVVWIAGTAALLWLSFHMLREAFHPKAIDANAGGSGVAPLSLSGHFGRGAVIALSSPTAILWFATAGTALIAASTAGQGRAGLAFFFGGFTLASVLWSALLGGFTGRLHGRLGMKLTSGLAFLSALLFLGLAVKVFFDARPN
jgi:L-lysine exporter family protein LysE/ArgO